MIRSSLPALPALLGLAALVGLSACNGNPDETAVQCPRPYLLPDADTLSRYRGAGRDLSDLVFSARLTDVKGACTGVLGTKLEGAHAHVVMVVTRGPAASGAEIDVPYGLGVLRNGQVQDVARYSQHVIFPPNVNTVEVAGQEIAMKLPTGKAVSGTSYHLYFWLQLTPAELAANRRR